MLFGSNSCPYQANQSWQPVGAMRASPGLTAMSFDRHPLRSDKVTATAVRVDSDPQDARAAVVMECLHSEREQIKSCDLKGRICLALPSQIIVPPVSLPAPSLNRLLDLQRGEKPNVGAGRGARIQVLSELGCPMNAKHVQDQPSNDN